MYFHLNNNLRKRKKNCNKQPTQKKKRNPGLFFLTQMLGWAFWVIYLGYFFSVWVAFDPASGYFFSVTQILGQSTQRLGYLSQGFNVVFWRDQF